MAMTRVARILYGIVFSVVVGCGPLPEYVWQAGMGQARLSRQGVPLARALRHPETPTHHRALLAEVPGITSFAVQNGLRVGKNYRKYVRLNRQYVVWFVSAAQPLAFEPKTWSFPIVGSFPGLGFFSYDEALAFRSQLKAEGYDVFIRGVSAFSTGGWFADPLVSSMLPDGPLGVGYLVNVLLHESVHATLLVPDQSTFNESIASFVADTITPDYLEQRFGKQSVERSLYLLQESRWQKRSIAMQEAYHQLQAVYEASDKTDQEKLIKKQEILLALETEWELSYFPNNASLSNSKTYGTGQQVFSALFARCHHDVSAFLRAAREGIAKAKEPQLDNFDDLIASQQCKTP